MIWIRSQDKKSLINCSAIWITEVWKGTSNYCWRVIGGKQDFEDSDLGEYKTKEKAMEVLDMIQENIFRHIANVITVEEAIFQMPQDEDV